MLIKKFEVYGIRLQLKSPFIVSYDTFDDMPVILVKVETDSGVIGWGEAVPDPHVTSETWESTFQVIKYELASLLINENPFNINKIHNEMNSRIFGTPSAKAALDIALYDLMGKLTNQPVYKLIGGKSHQALKIPQVISILEPTEMALEAKQFALDGFTDIKIKVGTDAVKDVERIRAVRRELPSHIKLRVDANQGWSRNEAIYVINNTRDCHVEWYEQPVKASDFQSMAEIRRATNVNIMADESVHSPENLLEIIQLRAADLVNIKLMKAGGIYPSLSIAKIAEAARMECQVGSMVESAIGTMAGAHLSLSQAIIKSNEMVGPLMFLEDVAETNYIDGHLMISDLPGLGVEVDESFIKNRTILHCSIQS